MWGFIHTQYITQGGIENVVTFNHILTLCSLGRTCSDPSLAKRLPGCLLSPYLRPIYPIKKLRGQNVLIAEQQVKTKPLVITTLSLLLLFSGQHHFRLYPRTFLFVAKILLIRAAQLACVYHILVYVTILSN